MYGGVDEQDANACTSDVHVVSEFPGPCSATPRSGAGADAAHHALRGPRRRLPLRLRRARRQRRALQRRLAPRPGRRLLRVEAAQGVRPPPSRRDAAACEARGMSNDGPGLVVVYGGAADAGAAALLGDLWVLAFSLKTIATWSAVVFGPDSSPAPAPRLGATLARAGTAKVLLFGGLTKPKDAAAAAAVVHTVEVAAGASSVDPYVATASAMPCAVADASLAPPSRRDVWELAMDEETGGTWARLHDGVASNYVAGSMDRPKVPALAAFTKRHLAVLSESDDGDRLDELLSVSVREAPGAGAVPEHRIAAIIRRLGAARPLDIPPPDVAEPGPERPEPAEGEDPPPEPEPRSRRAASARPWPGEEDEYREAGALESELAVVKASKDVVDQRVSYAHGAEVLARADDVFGASKPASLVAFAPGGAGALLVVGNGSVAVFDVDGAAKLTKTFAGAAAHGAAYAAAWVSPSAFVVLGEHGGFLWREAYVGDGYAAAPLLSDEKLAPQLAVATLDGGSGLPGRESFATGGADGSLHVCVLATGGADGDARLGRRRGRAPDPPVDDAPDPAAPPDRGNWINGTQADAIGPAPPDDEAEDASTKLFEPTYVPEPFAVTSLDFAAGAAALLVASADGTAREFALPLEAGGAIGDGATRRAGPGHAVATHPRGKAEAATAGGVFEGLVKLWDTEKHKVAGELSYGSSAATAVDYSPTADPGLRHGAGAVVLAKRKPFELATVICEPGAGAPVAAVAASPPGPEPLLAVDFSADGAFLRAATPSGVSYFAAPGADDEPAADDAGEGDDEAEAPKKKKAAPKEYVVKECKVAAPDDGAVEPPAEDEEDEDDDDAPKKAKVEPPPAVRPAPSGVRVTLKRPDGGHAPVAHAVAAALAVKTTPQLLLSTGAGDGLLVQWGLTLAPEPTEDA
ncbi:intracellular chloride channel [Aureococcus anophagefferens]|nr:intracellular chloride channel [Aureococcus anophagefferens]